MEGLALLSLSHLRIELFKVNYTGLWNFWTKGAHPDTFWHLYWNDLPDAGIFVGGKKVPLTPDKLYLLPPGVLKTYCDSPHVHQLYCHFYFPGFHSDRKIMDVPMTPFMKQLKERMLAEFLSQSPCTRFSAMALIAEALHALPEEWRGFYSGDITMESIRKFLENNIGAPITVTGLARQFNLPEAELSRRFFKIYNLTPYRYLTLLRYEHAARLLRTSEHSIDEICALIGCADRNYFTRSFKRHFGMPPNAYRQQNRD